MAKRLVKAAPPALRAPRYLKAKPAPQPNPNRAGRYPSLLWSRQWIAALKQLFPAGLTQEAVDQLWPAAVEQWRFNLTAQVAALNVCRSSEGIGPAEIGRARYTEPLNVERGPRGSAIGPPAGLPAGGGASSCEGPECSLGLMGGSCGLPAQLLTPNDQGGPAKHLARYCLIDADKVITSHDPLHHFRPRSSYPAGVQERRYDRDKNEQLKVIEIAQRLRPELIFSGAAEGASGLPVVNEQAIALGGNGRAMAVQLAYQEDGPAIKKYLTEHARDFGFSPVEVRKMKRPMVVRVLRTGSDPTELARLVRVLNLSFTGGIDARGLAVAQARTLDRAAIDELSNNISDDKSLAEFLNAQQSRSFIAALRKSQIVNERNANELLRGDGLLNRTGKQLVENLLMGALISDADLLDAAGDELYNSLSRTAPYLLSAAAVNQRFDLRPALMAAVRDRIAMRQDGYQNVDQYLAQGSLLGQGAAVRGVPLAEQLLRVILELESAPVKFSRFGRDFLALARRMPEGQGSLLGGEEISARQALLDAGKAQGVRFP